jgi:hypothetical protein
MLCNWLVTPLPDSSSIPSHFIMRNCVHQFAVGKIEVFRDFTPGRLVSSYRRFEGACCLHLEGQTVPRFNPQRLLEPEEGGTTLLPMSVTTAWAKTPCAAVGVVRVEVTVNECTVPYRACELVEVWHYVTEVNCGSWSISYTGIFLHRCTGTFIHPLFTCRRVDR